MRANCESVREGLLCTAVSRDRESTEVLEPTNISISIKVLESAGVSRLVLELELELISLVVFGRLYTL